MTAKVSELYESTKSFSEVELDELIGLLVNDPRIAEDLLDLALIKESEAEGGESVTLEEFRAGKRTYQ